MLYNGANGCGCFSQIRGTLALAAEAAPPPEPDAARLERGPGPGEAPAGTPTLAAPPATIVVAGKDGRPDRSIPIPPLTVRPVVDSWIAQEDHPLPETEPVVTPDGDLVAVTAEHRLECRQGGRVRWSVTADARITAPPVVVGDAVVFGAHDGWVYAVDRATGLRRWRALVAPAYRRIVAYGQFESAWPVRRLAVHQGLVCAAAGRHPEVDGGIHLAGLDPASGTRRWQGRYAVDTATRWKSVAQRDPKSAHVNRITNGGLESRDGRLFLLGLDGSNRVKDGGEPLEIDPADPPR
jgi:outer membrane protein assembly factor BamB